MRAWARLSLVSTVWRHALRGERQARNHTIQREAKQSGLSRAVVLADSVCKRYRIDALCAMNLPYTSQGIF